MCLTHSNFIISIKKFQTFGLSDEVVKVWWSNVKGYDHSKLKKYFYGYTFISAGGINPYSVVS